MLLLFRILARGSGSPLSTSFSSERKFCLDLRAVDERTSHDGDMHIRAEQGVAHRLLPFEVT
jgi:hypothetical protein